MSSVSAGQREPARPANESQPTPIAGPLAGIRVIDVTTVLSGPFCTMMLADAGADVIKVEPPGGDPSRTWGPPFVGNEGAEFIAVNRNKRSIELDLKLAEQRATLIELVKGADVFVENYRRGVPERLGIDYETLRQVNPRLVYCSISGFGNSGPRRDQAAYDAIMQAFTGIMHMTGHPGSGPTRASASLCDVGAGMYANQAILLALMARDRTGVGQLVEVSLFETQVAWMLMRAVGYFATGKAPQGKMGAGAAHLVPYDAYPAADAWIVIAAGNEQMWQRFADAIGRPDFKTRPEYLLNHDRVVNRAQLDAEIKAVLAARTASEWEQILSAAGVPCSRVNTIEDALLDPQTAARDMVMEMDHPVLGKIRMPGLAIKMSDTPGAGRLPPPILDQHRDEILAEIGQASPRGPD